MCKYIKCADVQINVVDVQIVECADVQIFLMRSQLNQRYVQKKPS